MAAAGRSHGKPEPALARQCFSATKAATSSAPSDHDCVPSAGSSPATAPRETAPPNERILAETPPPVSAPEVQRVNLKDGDFHFSRFARTEIAKFTGLDFRSSFRTATELKGNARVEKVSLRNRFFIEDLESPLRYEPGALAFSNISAHAAGGRISGQFRDAFAGGRLALHRGS